MDLDRTTLEKIYDTAKAANDDERATLAGALLMLESEYEKLRQAMKVLSAQTDDFLTVATMAIDPKSVLGQRAASLKAFIGGTMRGEYRDPMLKELHFVEGKFTMAATHWAASLIVQSLGATLVKDDGHAWNFVELQFDHKELGPLLVLVQRMSGQTPSQKLAEVERKLQTLLAAHPPSRP